MLSGTETQAEFKARVERQDSEETAQETVPELSGLGEMTPFLVLVMADEADTGYSLGRNDP